MSLNMSRKEKVAIGGLIWVGLCVLYGAYSSFIPNALMTDGVQSYGPYCFAASWVLLLITRDKKSGTIRYKMSQRSLEEKKSFIGYPPFFYIFSFVFFPVFIVFITWFILFTQTNVWGQITSWQQGVEQVEIERFKRGRSKRALGTTAFWVKDQNGEKYRVIIKDHNLFMARGVKVDEAKYAKLEVRKGPLGRFVNKVTLLSDQIF